MAAKVNLLPTDLAPSEGVSKAGGVLRKVALFAVSVFLIVAFVGGGTYYVLSNQLNDLESRQEELKGSITSLQSTEAQLVYTKDRISKIQSLLSLRTSEEIYAKQLNVVNSMPFDMTFRESDLASNRSTVELGSPNSRSMVDLMSVLLSRSDFVRLVVDEISFNSLRGYSLIFEIL